MLGRRMEMLQVTPTINLAYLQFIYFTAVNFEQNLDVPSPVSPSSSAFGFLVGRYETYM